jgi:hypothetical protein
MRGRILIDDGSPETYTKQMFAKDALQDAATSLEVPSTLARMKTDKAYKRFIEYLVSSCFPTQCLSSLTCYAR